MTGAVSAAACGGVPDRVRVAPSRDSQLGAFESEYVRASSEAKVDAEKVKLKG